MIRRGFADIAGGQVHYRTAGEGGPRPLVMLHASPGSAKMLEPLIERFAATRRVIALDTLGNGDSSAPAVTSLEVDVFVAGHLAAMDVLQIGEFDLYGSHTGGNLACEIAIARPLQVNHLILDGMSLFSAAERADMLAHYAPPVDLRDDGTHLLYLWNFVRDTFLFWPWYRRDATHVRGIGLPPLDVLHDKVVEVVKAARSFHFSYNSAFNYEKESRLPLVGVPTLLTCAHEDMLLPYQASVAALMPCARASIYHDLGEGVATMIDFLDGMKAS